MTPRGGAAPLGLRRGSGAVRSASGVRAPIAIYARIRHFLALHNPRQLPIGSMLNVTSYMR